MACTSQLCPCKYEPSSVWRLFFSVWDAAFTPDEERTIIQNACMATGQSYQVYWNTVDNDPGP